ncbi:MAG: ADP-ribosylglycohydrolase family protein [Bulleidia sp.]
MIGAILGDIIGSPFEFDRGKKTKKFNLFTDGCEFTDDTVMTVAVAEALMHAGTQVRKEVLERELVRSMRTWGNRYPYAGYGNSFAAWLVSADPKPYHSYGNGSAMRVSSAGWLYDTLELTEKAAGYTAEVTHNHPEGIKGAKSVAAAIFLARNGADLQKIRSYVQDTYGYDFSRTLDQIRPYHHMDETCQNTVPEAFTALFESRNFEDAVRNAVSLGGDTDTLAAITGSMAEAYYGIPSVLVDEALNRIPQDMREVVREFEAEKKERLTDIMRTSALGML